MSGDAIAGDQVTANPTVQIYSGVYPRMVGGSVYLMGYHTLHKGMVSQVHRALRRSSVPARPSCIHCDLYTVRVYFWRGGRNRDVGKTVWMDRAQRVNVSFPRNIWCIHVKKLCEQL